MLWAEAVNAQNGSATAKPEEVGHYQDMTAYVQYPETRKDEASSAKEFLISKGNDHSVYASF